MVLLMTGLALAAEPNVQTGSFGLSYSLGQLSMSSANTDVLMGGHYFLAPKKAIRASVGLNTTTDDLALIGSYRSYFRGGAARPFVELGGGLAMDFGIGLLASGQFGGEVWVLPQLSLWGSTGLLVTIDDGVSVATASSTLNLALYF
ncbi:MAG: hypothetical protein ACON4U_22125 [Myxococcota bacterium]